MKKEMLQSMRNLQQEEKHFNDDEELISSIINKKKVALPKKPKLFEPKSVVERKHTKERAPSGNYSPLSSPQVPKARTKTQN